jgi:hypothetical protein
MMERYSGATFEPVFTVLSKEAIVRKPETPEYILKVLAVGLHLLHIHACDVFSSVILNYAIVFGFGRHDLPLFNRYAKLKQRLRDSSFSWR